MMPSSVDDRRLRPAVAGRARAALAAGCVLLVAGFVAVWILGQQATGATEPDSFLIRLYPGTWPPVARGFLWLIVGAAAVVFDLLVLDIAETRRGRRMIAAAAVVTGACFLVFAVASFVSAPWSVIH
jgi:hypothetical protein